MVRNAPGVTLLCYIEIDEKIAGDKKGWNQGIVNMRDKTTAKYLKIPLIHLHLI